MRYTLVIVLALLFTVGCKSKKDLVDVKSKTSLSRLELLDSVAYYTAAPDNISFKVSAKVKTEDKSNSFSVNVRMHPDSVIWMSVTAFGFEAARLKALPDSVFFVNKAEKKYYRGDYENASKIFNLPLNFELLQNFLLGNVPLSGEAGKQMYSLDDVYVFSTHKKRIAEKARLSPSKITSDVPVISTSIDPENYRPTRVNLLDPEKGIQLEIRHSNIEEEEKNLFIPLKTSIFVRAKEQVEAEFKYSRIKTDSEKLNVPFKFYDNYEAIR